MTRTKFNLVCVAILLAVFAFKYYEPGTSPNPNPDPTPGPGTEKVLIEHETAPSPPYTKEQWAALQNAKSGDIQGWMQTSCAESHVLDKDQDVSAMDKFWQDAVEAAKVKPLPNISVWNGRRWTVKQKAIVDSDGIKKAIGMKP